jgi:hypothetical protein
MQLTELPFLRKIFKYKIDLLELFFSISFFFLKGIVLNHVMFVQLRLHQRHYHHLVPTLIRAVVAGSLLIIVIYILFIHYVKVLVIYAKTQL